MNKLTKAAIAGAAGIALLLGGSGSLAYWNSSATVAGANIAAGELSITKVGSATTKYDDGTAISLIVPGDTVIVSQGVEIKATGDNMNATLTIDQATLLGSLMTGGYITTPVTVKAYDSAGDEVTGLDLLSATKAESITDVSVTIVFPSTVGDTVGSVNHGLDGQNGTLELGELKVVLTQIAPTP